MSALLFRHVFISQRPSLNLILFLYGKLIGTEKKTDFCGRKIIFHLIGKNITE